MRWLKSPGLWIEIKEPNMKQERQYLKLAQKLEIYSFIKSVGEMDGEHFRYKTGWSDLAIAQKFGITLGNATTIRSEIGRLKIPAPVTPFGKRLNELEERLANLEKTVGGHTATLYKLSAKYDELEAKFNRIQLKEHFRT
jgi:hypothetical protein